LASRFAHGGGTKVKLFECMAAGLPTVAFEEAIRGISVIPGEHLLVAGKDERRLLDALDTLATDVRLARSVPALPANWPSDATTGP